MKNIFIIFVVVLFCMNVNIPAMGFVKAKYAGEFMATGVDARPLGMGGAFVAVANSVSAAYWNPAGLADVEYPQIMGMYAERFAKIVNFNYGAIAIPANNNSSLAFSFIRLGVDDIYHTKLPEQQLELGDPYQDDNTPKRNIPYIAETFSDAEWAFYLSYAKKRSEHLQWGANVKIVTKQVWHNSAWGLGFDFGLLYRPDSCLSFGINLQDVTTTLLAWDTGKREAITPTLKTGVAYLWNLPILSGKIIPALDIDIRFENRQFASRFNMGSMSFDTHIGLEYEFKKRIAIRMGLPDVGKFTAGAGIHLPHLNIDYAFMNHELGDTHRISLQLTLSENRFGRSRFQRKN